MLYKVRESYLTDWQFGCMQDVPLTIAYIVKSLAVSGRAYWESLEVPIGQRPFRLFRPVDRLWTGSV